MTYWLDYWFDMWPGVFTTYRPVQSPKHAETGTNVIYVDFRPPTR